MPRKPSYDRTEMIQRARDLFWRRGWSGTSMKDLEASLQMKPGSFYAAFGSKEALFELALETYATDGLARLDELTCAHGPIKALQQFLTSIVEKDEVPSKACMLAKTFLELHTHNHPLAARADQHLITMENKFAEMFAHAQSLGEIDAVRDPKALARRYQSDLLGLRVSAERDKDDAAVIAAEMTESLAAL